MSNDLFSIKLKDIHRITQPSIHGIEVTQGIQYYKADQHLKDLKYRNVHDNSVPLVANKPAWVRVYIQDLLLSGRTVTGELSIEQSPPVWANKTTLLPEAPGTIITQNNPKYKTVRSNISFTLNFIIPQELMSHSLRLIAKIWLQDGNSNNQVDTYEINLDVMLRQTLSLRGVMISYLGLNPNAATPPPTINSPPSSDLALNLSAPTIADLQDTAAWTLTVNPVRSQGVFSSAGTIQWTTPLTDPGDNDGCSPNWRALITRLVQVITLDGNRSDVIYYGLLPFKMPIGTVDGEVAGCGQEGLAVGPTGIQNTMAHEVGHAASLDHAPCDQTRSTLFKFDDKYPLYDPYDYFDTKIASLGEYGLDINNGKIHPPGEKDYMSYCWPQWISLYHQLKLTNNPRFNPKDVMDIKIPELVDPYLWPWEYIPDPPWPEINPGNLKMKAQKVISIIGIYNEEHQLEVHSVMRVIALPSVNNAIETNFVSQLLGSGGEVLSRARVMRFESHAHCPCCQDKSNSKDFEGQFVFQTLIPDVGAGSALRILKIGNNDDHYKEIWIRQAPERPPQITQFEVNVNHDQGFAEWNAESFAEQKLEFSLQFTKDKGRSWNSLTVGVHDFKYEFSLNDLPSGLIIFRLLAHDGFFTSAVDSKPVEIPKHGPITSILHPQESSTLKTGIPMRLWATVNTSVNPEINLRNHIWKLDGEEVAQGIDTWIPAPKQGDHKCTFIVQYDDTQSEITISFNTIDPDRNNERL